MKILDEQFENDLVILGVNRYSEIEKYAVIKDYFNPLDKHLSYLNICSIFDDYYKSTDSINKKIDVLSDLNSRKLRVSIRTIIYK